MDRQSFTLKWTAIGGDVLLEIPRNHLEGGQTDSSNKRAGNCLGPVSKGIPL